MPKQQTDALIALILTLKKSEKRHFKLFATRNQEDETLLYLQLFDEIEKKGMYDEKAILKKIPFLKKSQLSNVKAHLYRQLLLSLRIFYRNQYEDIVIRERLDYARILYQKGLYEQSLEMLEIAKKKALLLHLPTLALEANEFERLIESQYITNNTENRAEELTKEAINLSEKSNRTQVFSNLSFQLYSLFLKIGYVRSEEDVLKIKGIFYEKLPEYDLLEMGFYEKVYLYQAYSMYYFVCQDFLMHYKYTQKCLTVFEENPQMLQVEVILHLKILHSELNALFYLSHYERFMYYFSELKNYKLKEMQDSNAESQLVLFQNIHTIRKHFLEGTFSEGLKIVPNLLFLIEKNPYHWDDYRIVMFHYKIACLYFGSGDMNNTITFLNKIILERQPNFREDIQCFARILSLIAHFELGNLQLLEYQVKSVYRFLLKMEDMHEVQKQIIVFIRNIPNIKRENLKKKFIELHDNLLKIKQMPYEKRAFLYLDIIGWLESKIQGKSVEVVLRNQFLESGK